MPPGVVDAIRASIGSLLKAVVVEGVSRPMMVEWLAFAGQTTMVLREIGCAGGMSEEKKTSIRELRRKDKSAGGRIEGASSVLFCE